MSLYQGYAILLDRIPLATVSLLCEEVRVVKVRLNEIVCTHSLKDWWSACFRILYYGMQCWATNLVGESCSV